MSIFKKAIVLLSGGLDSTTVLAIVKSKGYEIFSLSFDYGQRHSFELTAAKKVATMMSVKQHLVLNSDLNKIGGSALTDSIPVPKKRDISEMSNKIPITYVPARNTIFLSYALAWAETLKSTDIFIGTNTVDYSGYPDCRPEFIQAFEKMAMLGTKTSNIEDSSIKIHTPLMDMSKAEIIEKGISLGVDYSMTHSCYDPNEKGLACGQCDSCILRKRGFSKIGIKDPTSYI